MSKSNQAMLTSLQQAQSAAAIAVKLFTESPTPKDELVNLMPFGTIILPFLGEVIQKNHFSNEVRILASVLVSIIKGKEEVSLHWLLWSIENQNPHTDLAITTLVQIEAKEAIPPLLNRLKQERDTPSSAEYKKLLAAFLELNGNKLPFDFVAKILNPDLTDDWMKKLSSFLYKTT